MPMHLAAVTPTATESTGGRAAIIGKTTGAYVGPAVEVLEAVLWIAGHGKRLVALQRTYSNIDDVKVRPGLWPRFIQKTLHVRPFESHQSTESVFAPLMSRHTSTSLLTNSASLVLSECHLERETIH